MRTPSPPQNRTTFTASAPSREASPARTSWPGDRDDEPGAPLGGVGELLADLAGEVPGQDHDHVRLASRRSARAGGSGCASRRVLALLVRVPVDGVVEEVRPDAAVVEERVALARCAVADDVLAFAAKADQQLEERALRLAHSVGEPLVGRRIAQPCVVLAGEDVRDCGRRLDARVGVLRGTRAATLRGSEALRRRRVRAPARRRSTGSSGARSTRSARGRSCRTRGARSASRGAGTRTSLSAAARAGRRRPRRSR